MQFVVGDSVKLLPGRVETLRTQGNSFEGITRIAPPGLSIVLISFMAMVSMLVVERFEPLAWLKVLQCGVCGMALVTTFLRSYWSALVLVLLLLAVIVRGNERRKLIGAGLVVVFLVGMTLLVVYSDPGSRIGKLVDASMDRFGTLGRSGTYQGQDGSLNWRVLENNYALSSIGSHPVIGLGMGARYRPWDSRLDVRGSDDDSRRHIHNGHLWIMLQSGLLGYLSFMWLSVVFLMRGFRFWQGVAKDGMKGVVLGFTLAYVAVLIAAVANSTFMQWRWTPVIGIMMGVNEVILKNAGQAEG